MTSMGNVVSITYNSQGAQKVIHEAKNIANQYGQLGKVVTRTNLQTGEQTRAWKQMGTQLGATGKTAGMMGGQLGGLAARFVGLQAGLRYAEQGIQAVLNTMREGIKAFRSFEKSMAEVSTILSGVSLNKMPEFTHAIEHMSVMFGKSVEDLSRGLYQILSAAVDASDAINLLYVASKNAIAGLSSVEASVDALTSVLNSYRMTVEQMIHVSDVMFQSVVRGKFTYDELANALGYVVPIAAQAGIGFEELSAALATATRHGLHLDMTSRGLALAIQNIIKPSKDAQKVAAQYGIDLSQVALETKGLIGFMEELNEKTGGNASIISQIIPNMRSYRVMMVLAGKGIKGFNEDIELMSTSLGRADEAFAKMANTSQMTADILDQGYERVQRAIGEATQELDFMWKKFEIWKGSVVEAATEMTALDGILLAFSPAAGLINIALKGDEKASERIEYIDDLVSFYKNKWKEDMKEMGENLFVEEKKPLYTRLFEGDSIVLENEVEKVHTYKNAIDEYGKIVSVVNKMKLNGQTVDIELIRLEDELHDKVLQAWEDQADFAAAIDSAEQAVFSYSDTIDNLTLRISELSDEVGEVTQGIDFGGFKELDNAFGNIGFDINFKSNLTAKNVEDYVNEFNALHDAGEDVSFIYDGLLGHQLKVMEAEKKMGDITHWVNLVIEDTNYLTDLQAQGFGWLTTELMNHITVLSKYEKAQEEANEAIKENSRLMRINSLESMKIQLRGMMRRRGLTRSEERRMKAIEIANMKLRIDNEEKSLNETNLIRDNAYEQAKKYVDDYIRSEQHSLWMLKDTRQQDIENLIETILGKEASMIEHRESLETEYLNMTNAATIYEDLVTTYFGKTIPESTYNTLKAIRDLRIEQAKLTNDMGGNVEVPEEYVLPNNITLQKTEIKKQEPFKWWWQTSQVQKQPSNPWLPQGNPWLYQNAWRHQGGTNYAQYTGFHHLEKGEQVLPRGSKPSGGNININIPIKIGNVSGDTDINKIASKVALAIKSELMSTAGVTKYGMR